MTNLAVLSLIIAILSLIVALRTAMLNYKLRASEIRRDIGAKISASLARADRAKLLLEFVHTFAPNTKETTQLALPRITEAEASLKAFASVNASRADHEVISMCNKDYVSLRALQEPLSKMERELDALKLSAVHLYAKADGTA